MKNQTEKPDEKKKAGRGGARAGAGRKKLPPEKKKIRIMVCVYPEHIGKVRAFAKSLKRNDKAK